MIELTYDPDARTLYCYFTSIDEGEDVDQIELSGFYLLDKAGQILGMHIDLGQAYNPRLLHFALEHDQVHYDQRGSSLRIVLEPQQPAGHADFAYPAIFDLVARAMRSASSSSPIPSSASRIGCTTRSPSSSKSFRVRTRMRRTVRRVRRAYHSLICPRM